MYHLLYLFYFVCRLRICCFWTGSVKMCNFGSATTQWLSPDHTWSATQGGLTEDEVRERSERERGEGEKEGKGEGVRERERGNNFLCTLISFTHVQIQCNTTPMYRAPKIQKIQSMKKQTFVLVVITYMYTCTCTIYGKCMNLLENLWLYMYMYLHNAWHKLFLCIIAFVFQEHPFEDSAKLRNIECKLSYTTIRLYL